MSKENLKQAAEKLFASTAHTVLFGVASKQEFFTQPSMAKLACEKDEQPIKFEKKEAKADKDQTEKKEYPFNSKDTIAKIKETKTLDELALFELEEDRKGVLSEMALHKEKLIKELEVNDAKKV